MKRISCLVLFFMLVTANSFSAVAPIKEPSAKEIMIPLMFTNQTISLHDFLNLTPAQYQKITGQRPGLRKSVELRFAKKQFKKAVRKDGTVDSKMLKGIFDSDYQFHWGGFLMGFLLGPIGVLATLFFNDDYRRDRIVSATYGLSALALSLAITLALAMQG